MLIALFVVGVLAAAVYLGFLFKASLPSSCQHCSKEGEGSLPMISVVPYYLYVCVECGRFYRGRQGS